MNIQELAQAYRRKSNEAHDRSIMSLIPGMVGNHDRTGAREAESKRHADEAVEYRLVAVALFAYERQQS